MDVNLVFLQVVLDVLCVFRNGILVNIRIKPSQAYPTLTMPGQTPKQRSSIRTLYSGYYFFGINSDFKDKTFSGRI